MRVISFTVVVIFVASSALFAEDLRVRAGNNRHAAKLQNEGNVQLNKGNLEKARECLDAALRLDPTMWPAYYNRARLFMKQRKWELAIEDANRALKGASWLVRSAILRAIANYKLERYDASLSEWDKIISLRPAGEDYVTALNARAWICATCPDSSFRNGNRAVEDAKRACVVTLYKRSGLLDTLAVAYAEIGDFESAVRYQERAIAAAQSSADTRPAMMQDLQKHLVSLKQRRPWRDSPGDHLSAVDGSKLNLIGDKPKKQKSK